MKNLTKSLIFSGLRNQMDQKSRKRIWKLDRAKQEKVRKAVDELAQDPYKKGEPLKGNLKGWRSLK